MMLNRNALFCFSASLTLIASSVSAASVESMKRDVTGDCTSYGHASLAIRPKNNASAPVIWAGIVDGVKHSGIDGQQASIIVTKDNQGKPLQPQVFEFANCTSAARPPPADYTPPTSGRPVTGNGIVRPWHATKHCLTLESDNEGARNSVLDSNCNKVNEDNTFFYHTIAASHATMYLEFASEPKDIILKNTAHEEIQFIPRGTGGTAQVYDLIFTDAQTTSVPPPQL
ncbi:hypothetical protein FA10DRAFT_269694 [Acaromyces ingoldii]|uniref:Ricin B lectin domain-containing protein n=1 Tax=Acaromyces ingoldii TaxID=215250 RepID=A0A316YH65_9BASI|nr:hypothetical protein FA10DRAFT_269694 [Acaromyces ingoldii]PWN87085.1 hypothetical protein FA10DRAFT_269694 [Acaromyces ingoldii]